MGNSLAGLQSRDIALNLVDDLKCLRRGVKRDKRQKSLPQKAQIWFGNCLSGFSSERKISEVKTPLAMSHMETWMAFCEMA